MTTVGVLHPGEMGAVVGAVLRGVGARVLWTSEARGRRTRERASAAGLEEAATLADLVRTCETIFSICPPHAAVDVARAVAAQRFGGVYVDANAVSPATTREIGAAVEKAGGRFVDGGIVGPPPVKPGTSRLYLSGPAAPRVAALLEHAALQPVVLDGGAGVASAMKMAYAAWNKGAQALILAVRAMAVAEGVDETLLAEWRLSQPDLPQRSEKAAAGSAQKAWRWIGEMEEIAATFADAGLPEGFHLAAAEIFRRLEGYKDVGQPPSIAEVARTISAAPTAPTPSSAPRS